MITPETQRLLGYIGIGGAAWFAGVYVWYFASKLNRRFNKRGISIKESRALLLLRDVPEDGLFGLDLVKASDGALRRGTVYVVLESLADKRLVTSHSMPSDIVPGGPERRLFKITQAGRRRAAELAAEIEHPAPRRNRAYLRYLLTHKWFVLVAGVAIDVPLWRLIVHDWSKFLPSEWRAYRNWFYGPFRVGGRVEFQSFEGVMGPGTVTAHRHSRAPLEVQIDDGWPGGGQKVWAHRWEVEGFGDAQHTFDRAWRHHVALNPHHWEHWVSGAEKDGEEHPTEMPVHFAREMVADWAAAGRAIHGRWDLVPWWEANKKRIKLNPRTRVLVEELVVDLGARVKELAADA